MKRVVVFFSILAVISFSDTLSAQTIGCGAQQSHEAYLAEAGTPISYVPDDYTESNEVKVQFFIACSGPDRTTEAASDADCAAALSNLNSAFTNTTISFVECSAPIPMFNSSHFNMLWDCRDFPFKKQELNEDGMGRRFDKKNTINIYIVNKIEGTDPITNDPCGVLGYTHYYGDLQGQKISTGIYNRIFLTTHPNNLAQSSLSRTLVHEMGHFFGLKHLNGDLPPGNTQELVTRTSGANWNITADFLEDTPADPCIIAYIGSSCNYPLLTPNGCGPTAILPNWCDANSDYYTPLQDNAMFPNSAGCGWMNLTPQQEGFILNTYNLLFTTKFNGSADLVSRDNWGDPGYEPNDFALMQGTPNWYDIWDSPDLWNCDNSNSCLSMQNPAHQGTNNHLRVKVTNNGCATSDPAELNMYWTMGSTGEIWPQAWDGTQQINGQAAGGLLTPSGIIIPALAAGQSHIATQGWTLVDPAVYNTPLLNHSDGKPMICFLSRFTSTTDPINNEQSNVHAGGNVIESNNLVTRNTSIVELPSNVTGPTAGGVVNQYVRNDLNVAASINLILRNTASTNGNDFSDDGRIVVTLDADLWNSWSANGYHGTGISVYNASQHQIELTNTQLAVIEQINISAETTQEIEFCYFLTEPNADINEYKFLLSQSLNELDGSTTAMGTACGYHVNVIPPSSSKKEGNQLLASRYITSSNHFSIFPNPVKNNFVLQYNLAEESYLDISVYDLLGRKLFGTMYDKQAKGNGSKVIEFDKYKSGYYILRIKSKDREEQIKFIKL